jgi:PIN domain nuclease of toxin-antitoxin system
MRLLLDMHVFLWRLLDDPRLSKHAAGLIDDVVNELFLSSVSAFEIAAKVGIRKLKLPYDVPRFVEQGMTGNQIAPLPLTFRQTYGIATLPLIHRDPFDRLLIAVAIEEGLTLLTDDSTIGQYGVPLAW